VNPEIFDHVSFVVLAANKNQITNLMVTQFTTIRPRAETLYEVVFICAACVIKSSDKYFQTYQFCHISNRLNTGEKYISKQESVSVLNLAFLKHFSNQLQLC